jgi:glycosyltransferase involved in cell wall biosynthesis
MPYPILFTIPNFITAGSGRAMLNIVERLDRSLFAPAVCVQRKGGALDREVERLGIPFLEAPFTVPARPYHTLPRRAWIAARVFRPYRFALWHSFHYSDDYTEGLIARMAGARAWMYTKKNMNWHRRAWWVRTFLATRIAAQNRSMVRDFFGGRWFRRRVRLIPPGVDTDKFQSSPRRLGLREERGIGDGEIVAGCLSHLVPVKNHPLMIRALARVPGVHLFISGKPLDVEYTGTLHRLCGELNLEGRVHFVGNMSDVPAFLAELDIFVMPSNSEGCPVALLEAMACGKPCIATDIPGSQDVIEHGVSGWLTRPGDEEALGQAIAGLAASADLRAALAEGARRRILDQYTIAREVRQHEAVYRELLA